jgi:hypothetical protein
MVGGVGAPMHDRTVMTKVPAVATIHDVALPSRKEET